MDQMTAFAMGEANRGQEHKVFDWHKAARIIRENNVQSASAGLSEDWRWTAGEILSAGIPVPQGETYTFLASTWATPELQYDGMTVDCFVMESATDGWDAATYWPDSARAIIDAL